MIRVRLQVGDGKILDTYDAHGLMYVSSDTLFEAPLKEMEKTTYPEQEGENSSVKTVSDAFDYKVEFFIEARQNINSANQVIYNFNRLLYDMDGDVKIFKQVTFYNDYKKVKIVGIPSLIQKATEFWRDANGKQHDVVCVEWVIRVSKPSLCDFNLK